MFRNISRIYIYMYIFSVVDAAGYLVNPNQKKFGNSIFEFEFCDHTKINTVAVNGMLFQRPVKYY